MITKYCDNCHGVIHIMVNQGDNFCSENCKKELEQKQRIFNEQQHQVRAQMGLPIRKEE